MYKHVCVHVCTHVCCGHLGEEDLASRVTEGSAGVSVDEESWLGTEGLPCTLKRKLGMSSAQSLGT